MWTLILFPIVIVLGVNGPRAGHHYNTQSWRRSKNNSQKPMWLSCYHEATVLYSWRWSLGNITSVQWLLAESSPLQGAMTGTNAHIMCQTCCTSALRRLNYRPEQQSHQPSPFHMTAAICLYFRERKMSLLTTLTATVTDTLLVVIFGAYGKIDHLISFKYFPHRKFSGWWSISRCPLNWSGILINSWFQYRWN